MTSKKIVGVKVPVPESTDKIEVPKRIIDQVVGQEKAVEIIKRAALQGRHILLIGKPGTGKSMLAQGMSELLPPEKLHDIIVFSNPEDESNPIVKSMPAGFGRAILHQYKEKFKAINAGKKTLMTALMIAIAVITFYYTFIMRIPQALFSGIIAAAFLTILGQQTKNSNKILMPKLLVTHKPSEKAPFIDATGAHEGSLLGDVKHDPFQSGGLETPSHLRVEPGAIHRANRGVLFIDEIATLSPKMQVELLTAMQEKKYPITGRSERSAGAMVRTTPAPCDFVLVAAGNVETMKHINPALRSRIQGYGYEVFMNDTLPDTKENEEKIIRFIAQEVKKDKKIPGFSAKATAEIVRIAKKMADRKEHLTLRLRELGGVIRAAGDLTKEQGRNLVEKKDVKLAVVKSRTLEAQIASKYIEMKKEYQIISTKGGTVGRVNGLAVVGNAGIVLPIEAEVVPGSGDKSEIIATGNLGKIAKEAVSNVAAIIRRRLGKDIKKEFDIYIQFLQTYEGVEGDSASVAVATAIFSSVNRQPVKQNLAMTGSLSVRGDVLPVGGINPKLEAAVEAGLEEIIIPKANEKDIVTEKAKKIKIHTVSRIEDVVKIALINPLKKIKPQSESRLVSSKEKVSIA